jgi:hypothetical protein
LRQFESEMTDWVRSACVVKLRYWLSFSLIDPISSHSNFHCMSREDMGEQHLPICKPRIAHLHRIARRWTSAQSIIKSNFFRAPLRLY